jgi:hypothetical protein
VSRSWLDARLYLAVAALGALFCACSLVLNFEPGGQPCGPGDYCTPGYVCQNGRCRQAPPCPSGQVANPATGLCTPAGCGSVICAAGQSCVNDGGPMVPTCVGVSNPALLGYPCESDVTCGAGGMCLLSSVQNPGSGQPRGGICVRGCSAASVGASCGDPENTACQALAAPLDAGSVLLCLPPNRFTPCWSDADCGGRGLVCALFDHPSLGPVGMCDVPLTGGAVAGEHCAQTPVDGGLPLCGNGLCLASGAAPSCTLLCSDSSQCLDSYTCALVEVQSVGNVYRHVPGCIAAATACTPCSGSGTGSTCGSDAPHCDSECRTACSVNAGQVPSCPNGKICLLVDGAYSCSTSADGGC